GRQGGLEPAGQRPIPPAHVTSVYRVFAHPLLRSSSCLRGRVSYRDVARPRCDRGPVRPKRNPTKRLENNLRTSGEKIVTRYTKDLHPFDIELQDVRRTFVEKGFAIHAAYSKDLCNNRMRHYYDLSRQCS